MRAGRQAGRFLEKRKRNRNEKTLPSEPNNGACSCATNTLVTFRPLPSPFPGNKSMQKKKTTFSMAGKTVPWYMVVFFLLFVAVLFFDFEHRQKQRFEDMNQQMEKLAVILRDTRRAQSAGGVPALGGAPAASSSDARMVNFAPTGSKLQAAAAGAAASSAHAGRVGRELSDSVVSFIYPTSFSRGNNTNFFWPYARQKSPEDVYRFLGTVDVEELAQVVKTIPQVSCCSLSCFVCRSVWVLRPECPLTSRKFKIGDLCCLRVAGTVGLASVAVDLG